MSPKKTTRSRSTRSTTTSQEKNVFEFDWTAFAQNLGLPPVEGSGQHLKQQLLAYLDPTLQKIKSKTFTFALLWLLTLLVLLILFVLNKDQFIPS